MLFRIFRRHFSLSHTRVSRSIETCNNFEGATLRVNAYKTDLEYFQKLINSTTLQAASNVTNEIQSKLNQITGKGFY